MRNKFYYYNKNTNNFIHADWVRCAVGGTWNSAFWYNSTKDLTAESIAYMQNKFAQQLNM